MDGNPLDLNTWQGVTELASQAGAKFPELVAAQWALESGWGKHTSGRHNYFGLKGEGSTKQTTEYVNGKPVVISDSFLDFAGVGECVEYLVTRWYKDWRGYKGVNRATSLEAAAKDLVKQGYATDPAYSQKLLRILELRILEEKATKAEPKPAAAVPTASAAANGGPVLFTLEALQNTWLKKEPVDASTLGDRQKKAVHKGRDYGVVRVTELPATAHVKVELAAGSGTWFIYGPHWRQQQKSGEALTAQVDWQDFGCLVTPHLTVGEILQWDRRRIPGPNAAVRQRILATAQEFEKIRVAWGRPLGVTSFYRPEPINQQVGGARNSRHVTGQAMDLYPAGGASLESFYQWIRVRWRGGLGDGRSDGFVHLDTDGGGFVPGAGATPYRSWTY
jgi:hypothetical protein